MFFLDWSKLREFLEATRWGPASAEFKIICRNFWWSRDLLGELADCDWWGWTVHIIVKQYCRVDDGEVYVLRNNERINAKIGPVNTNKESKSIAIYWKPNPVSNFTISFVFLNQIYVFFIHLYLILDNVVVNMIKSRPVIFVSFWYFLCVKIKNALLAWSHFMSKCIALNSY
jgi:hypothetical protein